MAEAEWHPKREAKRFEPPPWERDQFEAMQRARGPENAAEESAAEELKVATERAGEHSAEPEAVRDEAAEAAAMPAAEPAGKRASAVPDAQVDAMLIQLGAEEPRVDQHLKVVGVSAAALAMFFGACMLFWGLYALMTARGHFAAVVGALIVLGFGASFAGLGLWFGWRVTNRGE